MTEAREGSCEGVVEGASPIPQHIGEASAEATTLLLIEQRCVVNGEAGCCKKRASGNQQGKKLMKHFLNHLLYVEQLQSLEGSANVLYSGNR